jgi:hypothetical protein
MQGHGFKLRRIHLLRGWVNKGKKSRAEAARDSDPLTVVYLVLLLRGRR